MEVLNFPSFGNVLKLGRFLLKLGRSLLNLGRSLLILGRFLLKLGRSLLKYEMYMQIKVKGCQPMTYQHFTVTMFENAKANSRMVDQTIFKTAQQYSFNSLYFDEISLRIVDDYVKLV